MGRACVAAGVVQCFVANVFCARGVPCKWRRRLTFLKAGRGQTTSSSSAILLKKIRTTAMRSCSRTSQPRNCTRSFFPPRAEDFDKDGNLE